MKAVLLPGHPEVRVAERPAPTPGTDQFGDAARAIGLFQSRRADKVVFVLSTASQGGRA